MEKVLPEAFSFSGEEKKKKTLTAHLVSITTAAHTAHLLLSSVCSFVRLNGYKNNCTFLSKNVFIEPLELTLNFSVGCFKVLETFS